MGKQSWLLVGLGVGLTLALGWLRALRSQTPLLHQVNIPAPATPQTLELGRLEQVLTAQPASIPLLLEKARLQLTLKDMPGATKTLQEICRLDPNNPDLTQWFKQAGSGNGVCQKE